MYIIEKWNGLYREDSMEYIVAGFPTLDEAAIWCYKQRPIGGDGNVMSLEEAFCIQYVSGEYINTIPYPWGGVPKDARS